jgi:hypothetical protein
MVAQINSESFADVSHTPEPISSDPDDVRLALETAQAFQAMGDNDETIEWLERAAERADEAGQRQRALMLVLATAQFANGSAPAPRLASTPSSVPPSHMRRREFAKPPATKLPPCPAPVGAGSSSLPPPPRTSSLLPPPPRTLSLLPPPPRKSLPPLTRKPSLPPAPMLSAPPPASLLPDPSSPKGPPRMSAPPKRSSPPARANTIRVAISGWVPGAGPLTIERLDEGQALPAGAKEATLMLSDDERTIRVVEVMGSQV